MSRSIALRSIALAGGELAFDLAKALSGRFCASSPQARGMRAWGI